MARTKTTTTEPVDVAPLDEKALSQLQNTGSALIAEHSEERDLVNQLLGQAQMADAFAKFSVTVTTSKLAYVKESKLYKALAGKKSGDGHQLSGTWEEFCSMLGRSREQIPSLPSVVVVVDLVVEALVVRVALCGGGR